MISLSEMEEDHVAKQRPPYVPTQFCLVQDDDCHWYIIADDDRELFETWVAFSQIADDYYGPDFTDHCINSPHDVTFEHYRIDGEWVR